MATIYDVARLAGVSPATVSRTFNGANVSEAKAVAVRKAADQLHFRPNRAARTLRRQRSELIALIIPDIENPYFTSLARGVENVTRKAGYSLVMCNTDTDLDLEQHYLDVAISEHMAGVIIVAASPRTDLSRVQSAGRPIVAVDRHVDFDVDEVVMNHVEAGREAAEALANLGYRQIACISGAKTVETARERVEGWRLGVEATGGSFRSEYQIYSNFDVASGRESMKALLALPDPPDAVVAANNLIGVGAIQVLTERGLTPPQCGVAAIGSLPFSTLSPSVVSTVDLPARHMGEEAARLILARIEGSTEASHSLVLPGQLRTAQFGNPAR